MDDHIGLGMAPLGGLLRRTDWLAGGGVGGFWIWCTLASHLCLRNPEPLNSRQINFALRRTVPRSICLSNWLVSSHDAIKWRATVKIQPTACDSRLMGPMCSAPAPKLGSSRGTNCPMRPRWCQPPNTHFHFFWSFKNRWICGPGDTRSKKLWWKA